MPSTEMDFLSLLIYLIASFALDCLTNSNITSSRPIPLFFSHSSLVCVQCVQVLITVVAVEEQEVQEDMEASTSKEALASVALMEACKVATWEVDDSMP